jgi:predicted Zn-dependent protease
MPQLLLALVLILDAVPAGASFDKGSYRLSGTILQEDGKPFRNATPMVFLQGAVTPFSAQTQAGPDGRFVFKNLSAATYTLIVDVPLAGEVRRTVEVGPSFADSKGRVTIAIKFDSAGPVVKKQLVSAVELSVPESARLEYDKAQDYLSRRDTKGAINCLNRAIALAPQFAAAWNNLGTIAYQTRQYQQAEEYFRTALQHDPEAYNPLVNLGGALLAQAKIDDSLTINQRAVRVKPDDPLAHSQLGQSYYFLGKLDEAETHLRQAKALDPSHFSYPQVVLVEIYARRNQLPAAIAEIEEFLKLHPDSEMAPRMQKALADARARLSSKP